VVKLQLSCLALVFPDFRRGLWALSAGRPAQGWCTRAVACRGR